MASGSRHNLYIIPEVIDGTTPANPQWIQLRNTGTTLKRTNEAFTSEEIRADRMDTDIIQGAASIAGDISGELSYSTYDLLLQAAMLDEWTDVDSQDYQEVKTGVSRQSFSVLRHHQDITGKPYMLFTGVHISGFKLDINTDGKVMITFNCIGRTGELLDNAPTGSAFLDSTQTPIFTSIRGKAMLGAQEFSTLTQASITVNNNMEARNVLFSDTAEVPSVGKSNISIETSAYFEDTSMIETYLDEQVVTISFDLIDSAGNMLSFIFPWCKFGANMPDVSGSTDIVLTTPVTALRDPITQTNMTIRRLAA